MLNKFQKYYQENRLFNKTDKVLLTVSGGKDSMVMLHLFKKRGLSFGVTHCNFQLRGEDAKRDEEFVSQFCKENNIPCYIATFKTKEYAAENGISIQMAARDLRYAWFEKIRSENNYQFIATAHHKNDVAETMLINLTKGTGLAGLHGISGKKGVVTRPMLCFDRNEIDVFAKENEVLFREDLSNSDTKYTRNAIRHQIIPELEKVNPSFIETINTEAKQFLELEQILNQKIQEEKQQLFIPDKNGFKIEIELLKKLVPLKTYLYYFLKAYNYNITDVSDIIEGLEGSPGKIFYSKTHQIIKDRTFLLLNEIQKKNIEDFEIESVKEFPFDYSIVEITSNFKIKKSNKYAYLDADKVKFPLVLRVWKHGDIFQPLGMTGNKKVSDFLIDNKISLFDKENTKTLSFNNQILWVVGHRIDDRFKITSATKRALVLSLKD